jgi:hypothetical protein
MNSAVTLMWYEVLFWRHKRVSLCQDILTLNEELMRVAADRKLF